MQSTESDHAVERSDRRIVIDCPQCRRVIWAGAKCDHGVVVLTPEDAPKETPTGTVTIKKGKGE